MTLLLFISNLKASTVNELLLSLCTLLIGAIVFLSKSRMKLQRERVDNSLKMVDSEKKDCEKEKQQWQEAYSAQIDSLEEQRKRDKQEAKENIERVISIFQSQVKLVQDSAQKNHNNQEQKILELTKQIQALKTIIDKLTEENKRLLLGCGHGACFYKKKVS